jgi:3-phosphoshikimate 1-carboxyvinyltransferase
MSAPTDIQIVNSSNGLSGNVAIPGDKSIAHRCALLASLGQGSSRIVHFPQAADPHSTLACIRALGVSVVEDDDGILVIEGRGLHGWQPPSADLDCGNSGTTMRLMAGLLAGRTFDSRLVGDESLQSRPMGRIADPLRLMGALVELTGGRAPISIHGQKLKGIEYTLPVASAQVKSAVLLAGMFAEGETVVIEPEPTRDHTERMLGLNVLEIGGKRHISVGRDHHIPARTWAVPGDFSAAAFFLVAGSVIPNSFLKIAGAGMNPTRTGLIQVLQAMGADISVSNERILGGEPIADLAVRSAQLTGVTVGGSIVPNLIDEIPVLAVAAALADGDTVIRDAAELRVKETDRIAAMGTGLRAMGAHVVETSDGMTIRGGGVLKGTQVEAFHDHRIAMAMAVAGLAARGQTTIHGASAAAVSFPGFWDQLKVINWR